MAKRNAISDLNHDNWADEEEPEEAGTFRQADKNTLQGRVIKKAVRRGIKQADGPNLFSGFGGFKSTSDSSTTSSSFGSSGGSLGSTGAFDFLAKKTNGSSSTNTDSPAKGAAFNFASPGASETGFAFGTPGSKSDSVNSSLGNGNGSTEEKPASAGLFAFGSANAKSSFGSFGSTTTTTNPAEKSNESSSKADDENDKKETPAPLKPLTEFLKPKEADIKSDQDAPKKEKNWSCPVCMVSNAPDKEECPCCSEPKPGSKPKPKAAAVIPSLGGSITGAGFKFGATTTDTSSSSNSSSGFRFGIGTGNAESLMKPPASTIVPNTGFKFGNSSETNSKNEENNKTSPKKDMEYSREFLSHLKQLNKQVTAWLKTHVDKNPYVFLSPVFKDYERHLKDLEKKFKPLESQQKPLLGAVFGSSETNKNTEPVKFGTSSGFAFGSTGSTDQAVSTNTKTTSGLAFGSSSSTSKKEEEEKSVKTTLISQPSSGFGITSENSESIPAKSGIEKPSTGFSFAGGATDNKPSSQPSFTFGSSGSTESKPTPGFSFGKTTTTDKTDAPAPTGFSFGATTASTENSETKTTSGFSFGSTTKSDDKPATGGFTFGSFGSSDTKPTGFSGFGTSTFGAPATSATPEASKTDEADDEDQPPKVEVKEVLEDDAYFSVRCKLFYKKGKEFTEKGLGMLHLKKVDGGKTQLLVRAETNLGNILLNILVNDQMNIDKRKNNIQFGCIPNPPIPGLPEGPVIMLVKVKDVLMADQLEEKLKEATNPST